MGAGALFCCISRDDPGKLPPSQDSAFDKELLDGFKRALNKGNIIHSSPARIRRRRIEGLMGMLAAVSGEHFDKKRKVGDKFERVVASADPHGFNFTQVDDAEKISEIQVQMPDQQVIPTSVIVNVSPLAIGHVLLVPNIEQRNPQVLNKEMLLCGLQLLAMSLRQDFRLVFNSLRGFASVNHFHFHGLYADYCGLDSKFPIERVDRSLVAGSIKEGHTCVELLAETQWHTRGFVLSAGCKAGTRGKRPPADLEALASAAAGLVLELQRRNIPHNLLMAPYQEGQKPRLVELGMAGEDQAHLLLPDAMSPYIYIIPRQPESNHSEKAGFNAAVSEIAGVVLAHTEEAFETFTEDSLKQAFSGSVTLDGLEFDDLICKAAWLAI